MLTVGRKSIGMASPLPPLFVTPFTILSNPTFTVPALSTFEIWDYATYLNIHDADEIHKWLSKHKNVHLMEAYHYLDG